jgi:hypothetical protein
MFGVRPMFAPQSHGADRSRTRDRATRLGRYPHIEAALNFSVGFDPAKSAGIFTAGMAEYAEVAFVGRLVESFARQAKPDERKNGSCHRSKKAHIALGRVDILVNNAAASQIARETNRKIVAHTG